MSLAFGRDILAMPGPSIIPDRVLQAMHRPAPDIYGNDLAELTDQLKTDLSAVARTKGETLIYITNGHGAWEAALANIVAPGDHLLVLATGRFGHGWADIAHRLHARVETMDFGSAAPVDCTRLAQRLDDDRDHAITAILVCQTDTATSVVNDVGAIRRTIDAAGHPALFMVDCIASLACDRYEMDAWGVDVTVSACQKGLMTPPGLAYNHVGDKAWEARARLTDVPPYWDWTTRRSPDVFYMHFFGTAPTHHLFGQAEALTILLREEGLENVWARHEVHAKAVWEAVDAWSTGGPLRCNIAERAQRSKAVTCIQTGTANADKLRNWCDKEAGLVLGVGLPLTNAAPKQSEGLFRIGHMGHLSPPMILGTLATIEAGLTACGIPFGEGALPVAIRAVAEH